MFYGLYFYRIQIHVLITMVDVLIFVCSVLPTLMATLVLVIMEHGYTQIRRIVLPVCKHLKAIQGTLYNFITVAWCFQLVSIHEDMHALFNITLHRFLLCCWLQQLLYVRDHARENLKIAIVIVYAMSLMTAVQMQIHCAQDECSTITQVYPTKYCSSRKAL